MAMNITLSANKYFAYFPYKKEYKEAFEVILLFVPPPPRLKAGKMGAEEMAKQLTVEHRLDAVFSIRSVSYQALSK
jgi:hypothetical protein